MCFASESALTFASLPELILAVSFLRWLMGTGCGQARTEIYLIRSTSSVPRHCVSNGSKMIPVDI